MHIPTIKFRYSWTYDQNLKEWLKSDVSYKPEEVFKYIDEIGKEWDKHKEKVLRELPTLLIGLSWSEKFISCYVVSDVVPFSDPLTIRVFEDKTEFIDVLIHELIHRFFFQNTNYNPKYWQHLDKKYSPYELNTRIHIPVYAIHKHIFLKFFDKERLERNIKRASTLGYKPQTYVEAWEVVNEEDHRVIIDDIINFYGASK